MTTTAPIPPITGTVTIGVPVEQAFRVFTGSFDTWWPRQFHIGQAEVAEVVLEPHEGGRWYERGVDGTECDWGRVLVWEPPYRLVFTWQISGSFQFDPDPDHASEIDVHFTADGHRRSHRPVRHRRRPPGPGQRRRRRRLRRPQHRRPRGAGEGPPPTTRAHRGFGGWIALTDGLIHHQDIRRPLGLRRDIPAERVRSALRFARTAPTIGAAKRIRGLTLVASDLDWAAGKGPAVERPAEALLMAIAGRHGTAGELSGPGKQTLHDRIGS